MYGSRAISQSGVAASCLNTRQWVTSNEALLDGQSMLYILSVDRGRLILAELSDENAVQQCELQSLSTSCILLLWCTGLLECYPYLLF